MLFPLRAEFEKSNISWTDYAREFDLEVEPGMDGRDNTPEVPNDVEAGMDQRVYNDDATASGTASKLGVPLPAFKRTPPRPGRSRAYR